MKKTSVCYTRFDQQLPPEVFRDYLQLLPAEQQQRNGRYRRWQDRHAHLFGRLLLQKGWQYYRQEDPLAKLQYDAFMRPFIAGSIDFNISHAGNYVLCAISEGLRIGVDIELCCDVEFLWYRRTMNEAQWTDILESPDSSLRFFRYWVMKEAVIKADGRGLSVPLTDILFDGQESIIDNNRWFMNELQIDSCYQAWLACSEQDLGIVPMKFVF